MHLVHWATIFCIPSQKKMCLVGWQAMHALLVSFVDRCYRVASSWSVSEWAKSDGLKGPDQDCMKDAPTPWNLITRGWQCQWMAVYIWVLLWSASPPVNLWAFCSNSSSLPVSEHLIVTGSAYCCAPLLRANKNCSLWVSEKYQHQFPSWWLCCHLHCDWQCQMFPFHTSAFTLLLVVVNPHHVPSDSVCVSRMPHHCSSSSRKGFGSLSISCVGALLRVGLEPTVHRLIKGMSLVNEFISRTLTNVQLQDHYVSSPLMIIQNYDMVSFIVFHQ